MDVELQRAARGGASEDERSVLSLLIVVRIGCAEIDAGAPFKRSEKGGGDVSAHPISNSINLIARHEAAILVHR